MDSIIQGRSAPVVLLAGVLALFMLCAYVPGVRAEITADNWTEEVGFKPNLGEVAGFKAKKTIKGANWKQYKQWIPDALGVLIEKYKLKLKTVSYEPVHPSLGYIAATNQYLGQPKIDFSKTNARQQALSGYTAGLPFPKPHTESDPMKAGRKIAYNYHFCHLGDDGGFHYGVYWISAKSGVERSEEWRWRYITRTINRTDIDPKPAIEQFKKKDIMYTSMTWAVFPQDKRGFAALYSRYSDPKDQQGWIYIPTMRRVLRATFGTRGDAWNSTDLLYEDVRGFMGYPEWMEWKLVGKRTMLAPMHSGMEAGKEARDKFFDFNTWPHWNPKMNWEPRPVYEVEVKPRLADYPYSRMVMYFDAETYLIVFKEMYDKKGDLWKVLINGYNESPDMDEYPVGIGTSMIIDLQAEHATVFPSYKNEANVGYDPKFFTEPNLRKMGK